MGLSRWTVPILAAALAQSNEQAVDQVRKASEHLARGAYAEALKIAEELAKAKADKEGVLRVRVGAGLEDREFEPRRIAGDACMLLAKNAADPELRGRYLLDAARWYQASSQLGLAKAAPLLQAARAEKAKLDKEMEGARGEEAARRRLDALKGSIAKLLSDRSFEEAYAEVEKARPLFPERSKSLDAMKEDVDASFRRWQDALIGELRQDLAGFRADRAWAERAKTAERYGRYRVAPERASAARLDPELRWASRFGSLFEKESPEAAASEALAEEGMAFGIAFFRPAQNGLLESLLLRIRDPGPSSPLDDRWKAVLAAESEFAGAAGRARERVKRGSAGPGKNAEADLAQWLREDLAGFEARAASVRKALPDREAPAAVAGCLSRLEQAAVVAGAKREGYAAVEAELAEIASRAALDAPLRARLLAGRAVARAHALFLDGLSREDVLAGCGELLRQALAEDPSARAAWKGKISPRVQWVLDQARP